MAGLLTTPQAAKALKVTKARVLALIWSGRLKATKFGNQYQIQESDLSAVRIRKTGRPKTTTDKKPRKG